MNSAHQRLLATLGDEHLRWLLDRMAERIAQGRSLTGQIRLAAPTASQREALDRLLGRNPSQGRDLVVDLAALESILRHAGLATDLANAVAELRGEIVNLRARREEENACWETLWNKALLEAPGEFQAGLQTWRQSGLLKRLSESQPLIAEKLLADLWKLLGFLPASIMPLPELAARVTGHSHALDAGEPLSTLALRAIGIKLGMEVFEPATEPTQHRRDAWAAMGVLCDELSAPGLVLNFRASEATPTGTALGIYAEAGEPTRLSIRQLLRDRPALACRGNILHVCENPSILAAAAQRLGARSAPLLCTEGMPSTAVRWILTQLSNAGISVRYHGDFDWPGLRIFELLRRRHGALPWRFGAADYLASADRGTVLTGPPAQSPWDPDLAQAMSLHQRAVHEELVIEELLGDLGF